MHNAFETSTAPVIADLQYFKEDQGKLLKIKNTKPDVFATRSKMNEKEMEPLIEKITNNEKLMTRYADINEIASKETVHELIEPGSGIGKFGNYPAVDVLVNAINRDNIRPPA